MGEKGGLYISNCEEGVVEEPGCKSTVRRSMVVHLFSIWIAIIGTLLYTDTLCYNTW